LKERAGSIPAPGTI